MAGRPSEPQGSEIYIEFKQIGQYIKVTAIDSVTGMEASIVGDAKASQAELKRLAAQKLKYVLEKQKSAHAQVGARRGFEV